MILKTLDLLLRELLSIDALEGIDNSLNGVQVGDLEKEIGKIAFAVDASAESFRRAAEQEADMLFVHHGLLWSEQKRIVRNLYHRIKLLMESGLVLYAVHLPLDMHPELGNNIGIARRLNLTDIKPFGFYKGMAIGYKGMLPEPETLEQIKNKLVSGKQGIPGMLAFGKEKIRSVGIISGAAPKTGHDAINEELDLFISGEASHELYHDAIEARINMLFAGHYATEVWGVRQVAGRIQTATDIKTIVLDIPTGL